MLTQTAEPLNRYTLTDGAAARLQSQVMQQA